MGTKRAVRRSGSRAALQGIIHWGKNDLREEADVLSASFTQEIAARSIAFRRCSSCFVFSREVL